MSDRPKKKRIGEALVEAGLLSEEQLDQALQGQREQGVRLGEYLVREGVINSTVLVRTIGRVLGIPAVVLRHGLIDPSVMALVGEEEAQRLKVVPMFKIRNTLTVAMAEPQSLPTIDALSRLTGCQIRPLFALEANIAEYTKKYSGDNVDVDVFLASLSESDVQVVEGERVDEGPITEIDKLVEGSPVVNLVNLALLTAVRDKASDIHIEPSRTGTNVRYRIDGLLRELMNPPPGMHAAIASRVKVISGMDIAEKRLPQEGRIRIVAEGRGIDLRVSSMPTLLGEKLVIRILDKENLEVRMEHLGFRPEALAAFTRVLKQPHGLALVTGPTGSGKTTTLYSALELLRSPDRNLLTVEDPVEYQLDQINQVQVQEPIGMTFARALRSILRQDPDVIMVGEIRDEETARVGVQAALTGHLVLATLHTNDAPGAVNRLLDMGLEAYLLSSALNGVVAQRLVRTVCPSCQTKYYPTANVLDAAGLTDRSGRSFTKGSGCIECHNSGFRGRVGIYEVMEVTDVIRRLVHEAAPSHVIMEVLRKSGVKTLREEGVDLALRGETSLEEVLRATRTDEDGTDAASGSPVSDSREAA
ncbi:MAG: Flp pilus assembly complex ATPase component TadA [Phycisphaerales bacterium]|nr:Flp pilus assembly complex ATPase component TadA [Phycisphaerae bacterium]NNF44188.1 Flp pilus assembly complex ATPase component TadA [Phycisphaerales bacterium]NNM24450.1 Flp pilus assembly complex ATPase component TadA [Phycisphaerales bacterium]